MKQVLEEYRDAQVTSGNAISKLLVGPVFGLLAGWIVDRFGPRRLMLCGILFAGFALVGLSAMSALWMSRYGWHVALREVGLLVILIALPLAFFVKESRPSAGRPSEGTVRELRTILRTKSFYLLAAGSMCSIAVLGGTVHHLKLYLGLDRAYSQTEIAGVAALVLTCSIGGRLLMGWLADRLPKKRVMLLIYSLVAVSLPLLFLAESRPMIYVFSFVFGLAMGGDYMIIPLMAADLFGVRVLGRVIGVILTADGMAEATSPVLVGYLRDHGSSYAAGFGLLVVMAISGAIAVSLLPTSRAGISSKRAPTESRGIHRFFGRHR